MSKIIVKQTVDEFTTLANARSAWEKYWRSVAMYVLPHTANFDTLFSTQPTQAINSVVDSPISSEKAKQVYDMTSLWGIERLSAGLLTLKTPESNTWHDMSVDVDFGYEPSHSEKVALEKLRNYLFKMRANPRSNFWSAHKSAMRSMCAFGDGWLFVEELTGERTPMRYEYLPLTRLFPAMGPHGNPNRMFRTFSWSAVQILEKWPHCIANEKLKAAANNQQQKHDRFTVLHAVRPRSDVDRYGKIGAAGGEYSSYYCLPDESYEIAEGGYYEFPFVRYAWNNTGVSPFSEGPVAIALGEIKSLQEMAKNELLSTQMLLRPPIATYGKNFQRINFNAGAVNPGLINGDGRPLFAPINSGVRPDFAKEVMQYRRGNLREMLYLNLWQIMLDERDKTATEALIRAQEKGELLGPVGISMNSGLSALVDREVGILGRKEAFKEGAPLAMPESLQGRDVAPSFTSPLDRLRRTGELVAIQRLVEITTGLAQIKPEIVNRINADEAVELAQEILGAPVSVLVDREEAGKVTDAMAASANAAQTGQAALMSGQAAKAMGEGAMAATQGAEAVAASPVAQKALQQYQDAQAA